MSKDRFKKLPPEKELRRNVTRQVVSDYLLMALAIDQSNQQVPPLTSTARLILMQSKGVYNGMGFMNEFDLLCIIICYVTYFCF